MSGFAMLLAVGLAGASQLRVVVNIPAYRVDAYVGDSIAFSAPVAVGRPDFRTPRGAFSITSVEWNPWWTPPESPWARNERPMPPGPGNWMGRVKLNFLPLYFLHGTPFRASLGSAASHGCIRMRNEDAVALARLVHAAGTPELSPEDVARLEHGDETRLVPLSRPVALEIRYDRDEVRSGRIAAYRDVYGLSRTSFTEEALRALGLAGVDTTRVDVERLRALGRRIGPRGRSALIQDVLRPTSARRCETCPTRLIDPPDTSRVR